MQEKIRLKQICFLVKILLTATLYSVGICNSSVLAQQDNNMSDKAYKLEVLQKIASLFETNYVIPEMAIKYAEEFKTKFESGSYESTTNPKKFAEQVTEDLISITKDKHINFRLIESSDIGEKPESSLHHPIRYHRLGIKESDRTPRAKARGFRPRIIRLILFYSRIYFRIMRSSETPTDSAKYPSAQRLSPHKNSSSSGNSDRSILLLPPLNI